MKNFIARLASGALLAVASGSALADELNMRVGVTEISRQVYELHMIILGICVVIGIIVFGALFWSVFNHRKSLGAEPANFHDDTRIEIAWTVIPTLILILMAIPATQVLVAMYDTGGEDMLVEVRGYQWKWQYKYLDGDYNDTYSFFSNLATPRDQITNQSVKTDNYLLEVDEPLRIPANRKVRFLVTAEDVIHAWWVPDFGIKRDAVPGMLNELWTVVPEPGVYRGQCTELCGKDHGFMPIVVEVLPEQEFDAWYASKVTSELVREESFAETLTHKQLMANGETVYGTYCASCHLVNGEGIPPAFPAIVGSAIASGPRDEHLSLVINGVAGTAMQAFGKQLDPVQLASVVHYQRHAFGNDAGDMSQPQDVMNLSNGQ
ncbi:MAG TPA: cytochrome c oxidase subunit II [Gammaproteobacteria bacterium]|nr:MAG: cytochrome c oxidase subunit II [Gammaproteobacteria bacterium TMED134]HAL42242.1 cytochrome c oxidase subunit II [Gammaproteobacteria bacterium]